ncbi:MFS transporter [Nocardiopsis kunsanensis]|uniref:MFS transporter n=1 Tax=Nocardiopsis kunsanensis TaxID=141693 RepID=A0A918XF18_9ACTN|nr:MFS transporter [Nocardiopsis kunsanensis]GHD28415.1 MFS transporter [Nocardiopsis kunsanensis]
MATRPPRRTDRLGPAYGGLWGAGAATDLGDGMLATALPLIAAALTQDPLAVSGLTVARFLPWLLVAPLSGILLDRVDRMRAMAVANGIAAFTVALLASTVLTGDHTMWALYTALFVVICCETVSDPATRITVPRVVARRNLDRANGRAEGARTVAQEFVGPPVAGILFATVAVLPVAGAVFSYALSAVLAVLVLVLLRRRPELSHEDSADRTGEKPGTGNALREGLAYIRQDRLLPSMMACNAACMIGLQCATAVMVLYAQHVLGVPDRFYGVFIGAMAVGGLAGAVVSARLVAVLGRSTVMLGGYLGFSLAMMAVGAFPSVWTAVPALGLLGLCVTASNIAGAPFLQLVVPEHLRGRVSTVLRTVGWGLTPLGALLGGVLGRADLALPFLAGPLFTAVAVLLLRRRIAEASRVMDTAAEQDR